MIGVGLVLLQGGGGRPGGPPTHENFVPTFPPAVTIALYNGPCPFGFLIVEKFGCPPGNGLTDGLGERSTMPVADGAGNGGFTRHTLEFVVPRIRLSVPPKLGRPEVLKIASRTPWLGPPMSEPGANQPGQFQLPTWAPAFPGAGLTGGRADTS